MIAFGLTKVIVKTTKCQTDNAICKDDTYRLSMKTALREKGAARMNSRERRMKNMNMKKYEYPNSETHSNIR